MEVQSLSANFEKSALVNNYGELYIWGSAKNGSYLSAQGKPYPDNLMLPTIFASEEHLFKIVAVGRDHCALVTQEG